MSPRRDEGGQSFFNKAEIGGGTVVVSRPEISKPVAVRYGWADFPEVNLWNKEGLPASPFFADECRPIRLVNAGQPHILSKV